MLLSGSASGDGKCMILVFIIMVVESKNHALQENLKILYFPEQTSHAVAAVHSCGIYLYVKTNSLLYLNDETRRGGRDFNVKFI